MWRRVQPSLLLNVGSAPCSKSSLHISYVFGLAAAIISGVQSARLNAFTCDMHFPIEIGQRPCDHMMLIMYRMFPVAIRYIEVNIKWPWNDLENDLEREICLNRGLTYLSRCSTYMFPDWAAAWMGNCVDVGWVVESSSSPSCNTNWSNASSLCSCIVLNSLFIVALLMTHKNAENNKGSYLTKNLWKQTCFQTLLLLIVAYNNKGSVPMFWELSPLRVAVILLYKVNFCFDRQQFDFVL